LRLVHTLASLGLAATLTLLRIIATTTAALRWRGWRQHPARDLIVELRRRVAWIELECLPQAVAGGNHQRVRLVWRLSRSVQLGGAEVVQGPPAQVGVQ